MPARQSEQVCSRIIESFLEKLKPFGIDRFYYCIIPDDEVSISESMECCCNVNASKMQILNKMRFAVASDPEILEFREEFLHRFARSDNGFPVPGQPIRKRYNPYIWPENTMPERRRKSFEQLLNRHQVQTRITFYHPVKGKKGWIGFCHLFSTRGRDEICHYISTAKEELTGLLIAFSETFNALAFNNINPVSNFRVLSPTCIQILSLVAEGISSEEISRQLYMSERGVNYHLDRARHILMAKNRTNLVSKAYQIGLL